MIIRFASDLHFDANDTPEILNFFLFHYPADLLILAGDLCNLGNAANRMILEEELDTFSKLNRTLLFVPGNHEYYGSTIT